MVHLVSLLEIKNGVTACTGWLNLIPHTSSKRRKKDYKVGRVRWENYLPRRFLPAGGGDLGLQEYQISWNIRYLGNIGSFWKLEDKGSWVGTPVNKTCEEMK